MTLTDVMIGAALTMCISAAAFSMAAPVHGLVQAQPEASDLHQRVRVAVDALTRSLLDAEAVFPRRIGTVAADPAGTFRSGVISVVNGGDSRTYYLESSSAESVLRQYDGDQSDVPLVDHVVGLSFAYFGGDEDQVAAPLSPALVSHGSAAVRRVRISLRVEAAPASLRGPAGPLFARSGTSTSAERFLPDMELQVDVTLRPR